MTTDFEDSVVYLCDRIARLKLKYASSPCRRIIIALAGPPGSGKSTVAAAVLDGLRARGMGSTVVLPMDGFHYSKAVLSSFSDPELAFRKRGAPFTFDVAALLKLVLLLKTAPVTSTSEPEAFIGAPSFDHSKQDPVADDIQISSRTKVVIIEGNYTLLDMPPWNKIAEAVDERWFIDVPVDVARERLIRRHLQAGIELTRSAAALRAEDNDIPNGKLVRSRLLEPDVTIFN